MALLEAYQGIRSWEGIMLRAFELPSGAVELQVWRDGAWARARGATFEKFFKSEPASPSELAAAGIPEQAS